MSVYEADGLVVLAAMHHKCLCMTRWTGCTCSYASQVSVYEADGLVVLAAMRHKCLCLRQVDWYLQLCVTSVCV